MYICKYVYVCIYVNMCMYVYMQIFVCMYICKYVYVCIYVMEYKHNNYDVESTIQLTDEDLISHMHWPLLDHE